jgi:signal transduction histidine kinase
MFARYDRSGARHYLAIPSLPEGEKEVHAFSDGRVVLLQSIVFQERTIGAVYLERDLDVLYIRMKRYLLITFIVLLVCLIIGFIVSRRVSKSVSDPIVTLADIASKVSRGKDYTVRAQPVRDNDEVSLLVDSFNNMLQEIQRRDSELQAARDELELKVEQRTRQLVDANRELEAFAYSVSHDLRAPLETINGFSHVLTTALGARLGDSERVYLGHIQNAAKRMAELIDDLLNLSRVSTSEIHKVKVDLADLARAAAAQLAARESQRRVQFVIAESVAAEGDPRLLQLVIENLLSNAWKYTSSNSEASIEFGCTRQSGSVVYFVRDNGAGFDPHLAKTRLFKPFQRLHTSAEFPGTGIGLATVHRIIERHEGKVWAEGLVGKGATFYFTLARNTKPTEKGEL